MEAKTQYATPTVELVDVKMEVNILSGEALIPGYNDEIEI